MSSHMFLFYHYPNYLQQRRKRCHNTIFSQKEKTPQNTDRTFRYVLQSLKMVRRLLASGVVSGIHVR